MNIEIIWKVDYLFLAILRLFVLKSGLFFQEKYSATREKKVYFASVKFDARAKRG